MIVLIITLMVFVNLLRLSGISSLFSKILLSPSFKVLRFDEYHCRNPPPPGFMNFVNNAQTDYGTFSVYASFCT